jgi:hypothetical protein
MTELIKLQQDGAVAVVTLDNPPHNLITAFRQKTINSLHERTVSQEVNA